jgi:gamma-glutamylcyclotransferase (GGCT)/AIG2-like uncharacterized protein YtfP
MITGVTAMDQLFSYGTLQLNSVQMAIFGRLLSGPSDALAGYVATSLLIEAASAAIVSGRREHAAVRRTGDVAHHVRGTVFEVTHADLAHADRYEGKAYRRVMETLQSGRRAWVYVDARFADEAGAPPA